MLAALHARKLGRQALLVLSNIRVIAVQVWGMTLVAFLIGLPMLKSEVAFNAVASISVIGLYITYGLVRAVSLLLQACAVSICLARIC